MLTHFRTHRWVINRDRVTSSKDHEPIKREMIAGWVDGITAKAETLASVERYKSAKEKSYF
jgi:hypothetical protein